MADVPEIDSVHIAAWNYNHIILNTDPQDRSSCTSCCTESGFIPNLIKLDSISNAKERFFQVSLHEREAGTACEKGLLK